MLAWIAGVMLLSGFAHGVIGFGFPLVATPLLALALDLKSAILLSVLPSLVLTVLNAFRGGRLRESIGRFWYLPLCLAAGSYAGSRLLILPIQDIFGWQDRINTPAVVNDANWTWRLPGPVEDLMTDSGAAERARFLHGLSRKNRRS